MTFVQAVFLCGLGGSGAVNLLAGSREEVEGVVEKVEGFSDNVETICGKVEPIAGKVESADFISQVAGESRTY